MLVPDGAKAGKISKPYGLRGEVNVLLEPEAGNYMEPDRPLFIDLDGQRVPFFMESVDLIGPEQAIVKVEFISSVEEARKLAGCEVYMDAREGGMEEPLAGSGKQLIGYRAFDLKLGEIGVVSDHIPNEMNPVWVIKGAGGEIMIPATEDFIQKIDHKNSALHLDLPEGITEL